MKVLRVIASMDPKTGGPCQGIRNSIPAMRAQGVENHVVSMDLNDAPFLGNDDFKIIPLGTRPNPWAWSPKLLPWLIENIPDYDAVIVHGLWLYPGLAVKKATEKLKDSPPWFVMPHGMLDPWFQQTRSRKMKAIRNIIYWEFIERKIIESATGLLFTTREEEILAAGTFKPYRPAQTWNVGYGISRPPAYSPAMEAALYKRLNLDKNVPFLLFLSRIHPKKGVDLLVEAYVSILKSASDPTAIPDLVIAGPGAETDFGKRIIRKANVINKTGKRIHFVGMLSGDAKWGAIYLSQAFILPSHQENFGIAVAEALACHTPVLITDKVNIWREIDQGKAGMVQPDTAEGTAKLLQNWIGLGNDVKSEMGSRARDTFERNFEVDTVIKQLIQVLSGTFTRQNPMNE